MKDIMKEMEDKVKFSMVDSTMMLLVHEAMDKAHEKIKTKHGLLLRLNAISMFYELAVLQLESCLSFVQQETDELESNHKEVVHDLKEIKDRLYHRLLKTELAILEKDRELLELSKNQESLRNVLESKQTELVHLQDLERNRIHNKIEDFIKEDEFSELKSSVDQQVMNLRQKLETEYDELRGETEDPSRVDIDVLKGTLDLAFNKMHHAIFLSELGPTEQSWRWSIERDTMTLLIKGFVKGLEEKMKKVMMVVRDYESGFKDHICCIRRKVECLESQIGHIFVQRSSPSSPKSCDVTSVATSSSPIYCEIGDDKEAKEDEEEDSSNFPVSKLIDSHESIIRRKSEELVPPTIESLKRQKSCNIFIPKRGIEDIVSGLDSLTSLNTKLFEYLFNGDEDRYDHDHNNTHQVVMDDSLDDIWMNVQKNRSVFSDKAIEEKEDAEMKFIILEETYLTLLKGLVADEVTNNIKAEEEDIKNAKIKHGFKCMECLENLNREKDSENFREDEEFRQKINWIIVTEFLREVSETVGNYKKIEANTKNMIDEEGNKAFLVISLVYDDFEFKIQEKLERVSFRLQNLEIKIDLMMNIIADLVRKESIYKRAFVLRSENLRKAETEVDLLGDQVDSLVKLLEKILWTFHQHPLLLCNNSDISEISKMINQELSYEES